MDCSSDVKSELLFVPIIWDPILKSDDRVVGKGHDYRILADNDSCIFSFIAKENLWKLWKL